ncbi:hypothetical protein K435DRAFT_54199 [Dendrothele bispora CBS 962.96]|uniref:Uncharacterized protein n=1 Tax=Dendrothele bispora (strain CBS 962.96) TaxID=1314807 RepID=A0A4S8M664_DENBC|nr:hypothetical protein K435DRAFT_54199 [Dendrothele bispora CBS 962.96]
MNIPSLVSHTTLLNILLFFSPVFVAAFQISVPSTASLGTIPTATLTWDAGDPRIVSLSLVNGGDGTRTTIATLDVTEATVKSVPLPPLNVTGDFSIEALAPLTNGSSVTLAQSSISVFQSATSDSLTPGHANVVATTSTSDSSGNSQDSR